jgi:hypothetical protein
MLKERELYTKKLKKPADSAGCQDCIRTSDLYNLKNIGKLGGHNQLVDGRRVLPTVWLSAKRNSCARIYISSRMSSSHNFA